MGYIDGLSGIGLLLGKESTPGTEATTIDKKLGLIQSITPKYGFEAKELDTVFSQDLRNAHHVRKFAEFDVEFFVTDWAFLYYIFGGHTVTGTNPYTHTLTQSNQLPSYSAELISDDLGISRKMLGCKADNIEIKIPEGEEVKVAMSWKGMDFAKDATPQSATEDAVDPWMADEVSIFSINGVSKIDVAPDITLKYVRNLNPRRTVGSPNPRFVKEGKRRWEISVDQYQDDMEIFDLINNKSNFQTQIKLVRTSGSDEITLTFPQCKLFEADQPLGGEDELKENFTIIPYAKSGQTLVTASIIDSIADYTT